jgi:hypothetical protein
MNKRDIESLINAAVKKAFNAGRVDASSSAKDAFKATERRLYAIPILQKKLQNDRENLEEIQNHGLKERSKSIVRFNRTGYRVSPEEMLDAIVQDLEAKIAQTEHEIETLYKAMEAFADDPFYPAVTGRYIERYDDEDIALDLGCGTTQVWKQRSRIVKDISVMLYGVSAV